jgi:hypothetical protein
MWTQRERRGADPCGLVRSASEGVPAAARGDEEGGRVAIGTVVMRNKQYLAAIRPLDSALAMSKMSTSR